MGRKSKVKATVPEDRYVEPARGVDAFWDLSDVAETWHLLAARTTDPRLRTISTVLDALDSLAATPDPKAEAELQRVAEALLRKRHGRVSIPQRRELAERIAAALETDLTRSGGPMGGAALAGIALAVLESQCSEDLAAFEAVPAGPNGSPDSAKRLADAVDRVNNRNRIAGKVFDAQNLAESYTKAMFRALGCTVADTILSGRNKPRRQRRDSGPEEENFVEEAKRALAFAQHPEMVEVRARRLRELQAKFGIPKQKVKSRD